MWCGPREKCNVHAFDTDSTVPFHQKQPGAQVDSRGTGSTASISDGVASTKSWEHGPATSAAAIELPCRFGDYDLRDVKTEFIGLIKQQEV